MDLAKNLICVKAQHGKGGGVSCTTSDAAEPLLVESGNSATDPVIVVAVDPQRRLGLLKAVTNGRVVTATSQDNGFSIQLTLPAPADQLIVLDHQGNELKVLHPNAANERARQAEEELRNSDSHEQQ